MRIVADTNTVVSPACSGRVRRASVIDAGRNQQITLITGQNLLAELVEVLAREKFSSRIRQARLSAYDAYMLVLARTRRLPLLTLDQRLGAVAASAEVTVVDLR